MSGRESNARKKKSCRLRSLLGDTVLLLKPPYFFFKCWSFIILNYVFVRECPWDDRYPLRPEVLGPPRDRGAVSCEPQDMDAGYLEFRSLQEQSVCARSPAHLSSPTSLVWNTKVFLRFPVSLKSWHLTILFTLYEQYFFLQVFSLFLTCRVLMLFYIKSNHHPPAFMAPSNASKWPVIFRRLAHESILSKTTEKEHSSGTENTESLDPCIASYLAWERHLGYPDQPQMREEFTMFENGITKSKTRPQDYQATWDKKSWSSTMLGPEEDVFKSLQNTT